MYLCSSGSVYICALCLAIPVSRVPQQHLLVFVADVQCNVLGAELAQLWAYIIKDMFAYLACTYRSTVMRDSYNFTNKMSVHINLYKLINIAQRWL